MHHSSKFASASTPMSALIAVAICLCAGLLQPHCNAQVAPKGVVLFTRPPSSYPELLDFVSLTKTSVAFSQVVRTDGRRVEIPNPGIVGVFVYPPAQPDAGTAQQAAATLAQIDAALAKYPRAQYRDVHGKLVPLADRWRAMQQLAAKLAKQNPTPSPKSSATITTTEGTTYEGVEITKVNPDSISFTHSAGVATVDFEKLPPDVQRRFNYDPKLAAAAREARQQAMAAAKPKPTDTPPTTPPPSAGGAALPDEFARVGGTIGEFITRYGKPRKSEAETPYEAHYEFAGPQGSRIRRIGVDVINGMAARLVYEGYGLKEEDAMVILQKNGNGARWEANDPELLADKYPLARSDHQAFANIIMETRSFEAGYIPGTVRGVFIISREALSISLKKAESSADTRMKRAAEKLKSL